MTGGEIVWATRWVSGARGKKVPVLRFNFCVTVTPITFLSFRVNRKLDSPPQEGFKCSYIRSHVSVPTLGAEPSLAPSRGARSLAWQFRSVVTGLSGYLVLDFFLQTVSLIFSFLVPYFLIFRVHSQATQQFRLLDSEGQGKIVRWMPNFIYCIC